MYNLLVSNNTESWNGNPFILEIDRCVREYTDSEITAKFSELTQSNINEIMRFPCIFAYEAACKKDPKFGFINKIVKRQGKVKIFYKIDVLERFLTHSEVSDLLSERDILDFEMNRTHWAIKDVNLSDELIAKGIKLQQGINSDCEVVDITKHQFEVESVLEEKPVIENHDAFLCHETTTGHNIAIHLKKSLKKMGIDAFIAPEDIKPGEDERNIRYSVIKKSPYFIIIMTSLGLTFSKEVKKEIEIALASTRTILICLHNNVDESDFKRIFPNLANLQRNPPFKDEYDLANEVTSWFNAVDPKGKRIK